MEGREGRHQDVNDKFITVLLNDTFPIKVNLITTVNPVSEIVTFCSSILQITLVYFCQRKVSKSRQIELVLITNLPVCGLCQKMWHACFLSFEGIIIK